jgi:uncharacterized protein YciI
VKAAVIGLATLIFTAFAAFSVSAEDIRTTNVDRFTQLAQASDAPVPRMYMVRRLYDFTKDIRGIRAANEPGHQAHLLKFGQTVVSSALLTDGGARIGSVSISDISDRDEINSYVYDDPFTQGGIYKEITITPVELYKIDGSYNRAPAWFAPELERRQKAAGFNRPVKPTGNAPQPAMYLIRKGYAQREVVDGIIARLQDDHFQHLSDHGRNVVSGSVKDDEGKTVMSIAVGDYRSWDDVVRFVYDDPYTRAGMFRNITIERVDLYKLDGSHERAPAWFYDEMKRRQAAESAP